MRKSKLWKKLLDVEHVVIEDGDIGEALDGSEIAVVRLRPDRRRRLRCPECGKECRFYDSVDGRRRWRALDLGVLRCYLEADAPRVRCPRHGVLTAAVPWARPAARFTTAFEEHAAWLRAQMPWGKAARLLRVTWRTLQSVVEKVVAGLRGGSDRLDGVRPANRLDACFRKAEVPDFALLDQLLYGAGNFFDRNIRVDAVLIKQIDVVRLQTLERCVRDQPDSLRTAVEAAHDEAVFEAELRCNDDVVAIRR